MESAALTSLVSMDIGGRIPPLLVVLRMFRSRSLNLAPWRHWVRAS